MEIPTLLIGVIAVAVVIIAAVQVGLVIYGARLAHRIDRLVDQIENQIQPALSRVNDASGDVTRVTSLAVAQMERVDQLVARFVERSDQVMAVGQDAILEPLRRSAAVLQGLRVALISLRDMARESRRAPAQPGSAVGEDQEALFIG